MTDVRQELFRQAWGLLEPWHNKGVRTTKETLNRLFREQLQAGGENWPDVPEIWEPNLIPRLEMCDPDRLAMLVRVHDRDQPQGPASLPILLVEYIGRFFLIDGTNRVNKAVRDQHPLNAIILLVRHAVTEEC